MRFEKHTFNAWYEKHAFFHALKSLMLTYYNPYITHALKWFFSKHTFNARSGKRMFFKTPVLRMLPDVRKMCFGEPTLNMSFSIYTFTML